MQIINNKVSSNNSSKLQSSLKFELFLKDLDEVDNNSYRVLVKFRIKEYDTQETVEIVLKRLR